MKFELFENTPYSREKDMLRVMHSFMMRMKIKFNDWVIFRDHDTMFCSNDWFVKIEDAIQEKGDSGIYTCWTNRVNCDWQVDFKSPDTDDMWQHWDHAMFREEQEIIDRTGEEQMFSGMLMVIQKKQWLKIYPKLTKKLLGMDNEIHKACLDLGLKIWQIDLYIYHRYRWGIKGDKSHLR